MVVIHYVPCFPYPGFHFIYILPLIASEGLQIPLTVSQLYLLHDLKLF
jgi:hypothetical protein